MSVPYVLQSLCTFVLLFLSGKNYFAYFVTRNGQLWMEILELLYPCTIFPFFFFSIFPFFSPIHTILGIINSTLPACVKVKIR